MSDFETILKIFRDRGVGFALWSEGKFSSANQQLSESAKTAIVMKATYDSNVIGSRGTTSELYFDADGKLLGTGAWK